MRQRGLVGQVARRLARDWPALGSLLILAVIIAIAVLAPLVAPHDPLEQDLAHRLLPPFWQEGAQRAFLLGTDQLGRDILSRIIWGAQVSLLVGFAAVAVSGFLGLVAGTVSGYFGGWADQILMRLADGQLAIPFILLVIAVVSVVGPGIRNVIAVIGVTGWVVYARVIRSEVLSLREREFVLAARAAGASDRRILTVHVLPNVLGILAVVASIEVANVILLESALGFLGLGVQPPTASWGNMLGEGRDYLTTSWWLATWPGLALAITALSINVLGDFLRDALDPRLAGRL
ncbi:MAG: ABC transporter permease [Chloroflexi bacterium]|nr:ABC transporter permease [Chloroflexota bacterium]